MSLRVETGLFDCFNRRRRATGYDLADSIVADEGRLWRRDHWTGMPKRPPSLIGSDLGAPFAHVLVEVPLVKYCNTCGQPRVTLYFRVCRSEGSYLKMRHMRAAFSPARIERKLIVSAIPDMVWKISARCG